MANLREISFFSLGVTRVLARAQLHVEALPLAQIIFAFTPNSAAAERVFYPRQDPTIRKRILRLSSTPLVRLGPRGAC